MHSFGAKHAFNLPSNFVLYPSRCGNAVDLFLIILFRVLWLIMGCMARRFPRSGRNDLYFLVLQDVRGCFSSPIIQDYDSLFLCSGRRVGCCDRIVV
jgi:hypothetical protein